jgi:hypothetical protein
VPAIVEDVQEEEMKKEKLQKNTSRPAGSLWKFKDWHAILIIIGSVTIFFRDVIFQKAFFWEDFMYFFYPVRNFAAVSISQGELPLWNPYTLCGMPFQADIQSAIFYIPNLLLSLFVSDGRLPFFWLEMEIVVHYMIAGICMYYLAKSFGIERIYALFSGLVFCLSGFMIAHAIHQVVICQVAWFPLVVLLFRRALRERSGLFMILCGLILGHAVLAGYPQVSLYIFFFLFLLFVFEIVVNARTAGIKSSWPMAPLAAGVIIIALMVTAIQLLPTIELAPLTQRADISYEKSLDGSLTWSGFITLVIPKFFGSFGAQGGASYWLAGTYGQYWETCVYIGVMGLLTVIVAGALIRKNKEVAFLFGIVIFSLLYALGDSFILHKFFYNFIPGFNKFREPGRLSLLWTFAAALLSGFGLQHMMELLQTNKKLLLKILAVVAGFGILLWFGTQQGMLQSVQDQRLAQQVHDIATNEATWSLVIILLTCSIVFLRSRGTLSMSLTLVLLFGVQFIDMHLFGFEQNNGKVNPKEYFASSSNIVNFIKQESGREFFRVNSRSGGTMMVDRNQGMFDRIFLLEGYSALVFQRLYPPAKDREHANDLLNVKYYVVIDEQQRKMSLGRSATYLPRAFVVFDDSVMTNESAITSFMQSDAFNPARTVVLENAGPWSLNDTLSYHSATATISSYALGTISLDVSTPKDGYLVLDEIYYPGWKAYVDGEEKQVLRANWSLRAIPVTGGQHRVALRFEPASFRYGWWITLATLALCAAGIVYFRRTQQPVVA